MVQVVRRAPREPMVLPHLRVRRVQREPMAQVELAEKVAHRQRRVLMVPRGQVLLVELPQVVAPRGQAELRVHRAKAVRRVLRHLREQMVRVGERALAVRRVHLRYRLHRE